jgi:hypothetical protein
MRRKPLRSWAAGRSPKSCVCQEFHPTWREGVNGCAYPSRHPNVLVMEASEPSDRRYTTDRLHDSVQWCVLAERNMCAHFIVVGAVICQQIAEVPLPKYNYMVETFASD